MEHTLTARENATDRMEQNAWFKQTKPAGTDLYKQDNALTKSALDVSTRGICETGSIAFSPGHRVLYRLVEGETSAIAQKTKDLGISLPPLKRL